MQHKANQQSGERPLPLSYATPQSRRLGIVGLCCGLVSPCIYVLIAVLHVMNLDGGHRGAMTIAMVALGSAIAGLCLLVLALRRDTTDAWAGGGVMVSLLALYFNCVALAGNVVP